MISKLSPQLFHAYSLVSLRAQREAETMWCICATRFCFYSDGPDLLHHWTFELFGVLLLVSISPLAPPEIGTAILSFTLWNCSPPAKKQQTVLAPVRGCGRLGSRAVFSDADGITLRTTKLSQEPNFGPPLSTIPYLEMLAPR